MVIVMSPTRWLPPLFIGEVFWTPLRSIQMHSSWMPTTVGVVAFAMATASPIWSKCPCVQSIRSSWPIVFSDSGNSDYRPPRDRSAGSCPQRWLP